MTSEPVGERLLTALAAAEDALSRLDEQVRTSPVAAGWMARTDFSEAANWAWSRNLLAPLEDLVLHDAHLDVHMPSADLSRASGVVRARRVARQGGPELVSEAGALWLVARSAGPPPAQTRRSRPPERRALYGPGFLDSLCGRLERLTGGDSEGAGADLAEWFEGLEAVRDQGPDLLVAAFALEAWRIIAPLPREDYAGAVLVAAWLRARGRVASHLLPIEAGQRSLGPLPSRLAQRPPAERLVHHLATLEMAAHLGAEELRRLTLVRHLLHQRLGDRRRSSRAADLVDLLLASPLVSAPMAAERLKISQQAVRALVPTLGSSVRERTGRQRFRAWAV